MNDNVVSLEERKMREGIKALTSIGYSRSLSDVSIEVARLAKLPHNVLALPALHALSVWLTNRKAEIPEADLDELVKSMNEEKKDG